ncbi:MAG TPA: hypothetical protein VMC85_15135 [Desulfomonilaceae bacterium]|nr:hypothetical protein [Desulfomonilaceae bacterium]
MKYSLTPPRLVTWWISFVCLAIGVLTAFQVVLIPVLMGYIFWIVVAGLALMLLATRLRGL